ncbi:MAG: restriction endonuclease [Proteobacteria bacterium]|nr:restriction endonuclease [Pseudomonadota bacterium]
MSVPSSQVAATWVKSEIVSIEWAPLTDVCFLAVKNKWTGKSEEEVWDYVEKNLEYIAEHLRNEASMCLVDGSAPKFHIDEEQPPYVKAVGTPTSELLVHLRSIDPFKVEDICAEILKGFGAAAQPTPRTADGGIDFIAANLNIVPEGFAVPIGCRATIIGQTKRYKDGNAITEKMLREFVGAGLLRKHVLQAEGRIAPLTPVIFAFWTTSDFELNAKKYARDVGLWFMDGHTLATYVHSLGLADMVMALPTVAPMGQT